MKRSYLYSVGLLLLTLQVSAFDFSLFEQKLLKVPEDTKQFLAPIVSLEKFKEVITRFKLHRLLSYQSTPWLDGIAAPAPFHAQKLMVPAGSTVLFFGDLHGNPHSLMRLLRDCQKREILDAAFRIQKPNTYFVFLGDYVDRGFFSVELLAALLSFANTNPHHVILLRGNHEDSLMNKSYGFDQELRTKFPGINTEEFDQIKKIYACMPSVLYLGCGTDQKINFIQCCHGGIEIGYDPRRLLASEEKMMYESILTFMRKEKIRAALPHLKKIMIDTLPESECGDCTLIDPTSPVHNGFLWSDFIEDTAHYSSAALAFKPGRGWVFGKPLTQYLLKSHSTRKHKVRSIMRAHQHHGAMLDLLKKNNGFVTLYDGLVYTLVSSPIARSGIKSDAYVTLKTATSFDQWKLKPQALAPTT